MMGWCWTMRDRRACRRRVPWTSSIFPTIRGRRAGRSRCWRSATSTACTAATGRSSTACSRVAGERGATAVVMTFDPHPPRVVRPDKAPPLLMTKAQKLEALGAGRHAGRGDRPLHARAVAVGSGDVRAHGARRLAARRPKSGSARTSCSATIAPATSRCCATLGARYGFSAEKIDPVRYKDFVVSSTRIRRLVSEGRVDEAGALLGHQYFIDGTVVQRRPAGPRRSAFRPRTCAPRTSCCRRTASTRRRRRSTASCMPSVTNIGVAADGRRVGPHVDRDARLRLRSRSVRRSAPRSGSSSGCATSGRSRRRRAARADRRRLPAARACCSIAFHCRIARRVRSRISLRARRCPATRRIDRDADRAGARRCSSTSAMRRADADAAGRRSSRRRSRRPAALPTASGDSTSVRCRDAAASSTSWSPPTVPACVWRSRSGRPSLTSTHAPLQHPDPQRRRRSRPARTTPCGCTRAA